MLPLHPTADNLASTPPTKTPILERERESNLERERIFLRTIGRPLLARVKQTTGIVGLEVIPNAKEVLIELYRKTLDEIKAVPEDESYRKVVESFTSHRLKVCEEEPDWEAIEKRLGCGQVEEVVEMARDELKLISKMIENDAPVPKHVPLHRPGPLPEEFYRTLEAVQSRPKPKPKVSPGTFFPVRVEGVVRATVAHI